MGSMQRSKIKEGVYLTSIPTTKFKTSCLGLNFVLPLDAAAAPYCAILPYVLRRGTQTLPDMQKISSRLDELYGARIEPTVRKKGEAMCFGFVCDAIDGRFTDPVRPVCEVISLAMDMIFRPALENGRFADAYLESEKSNLLDRIDAQINDKRVYAVKRLYEIMCEGEPFSVSDTGGRAEAGGITGESLFDFYRCVLASAPLEIYYSGAEPPSVIESALLSGLCGTQVKSIARLPGINSKMPAEPKTVCEEMNVAQGKLAMGFRTGTTITDVDYPALLVANAVFGSGTSSKLFVNVREKLSLCYYASSTIEKIKGLMTISSGIETENFETAKDEILRQVDDVKNGKISPDELTAAVNTLRSILTSMSDSHMQSEDYHLAQAVSGVSGGIPELAAAIEAVGVADIARVFTKLRLDTIYFLKGNGGR